MSRIVPLITALLCVTCTSHDGESAGSLGESEDSNFIEQRQADFEALTLSPEQRRALEDRARLRERQRSRGLRVCEEGEHGTTWKEDCKVCQCEHGLRTCPAIKCRHEAGERLPPAPNRRGLELGDDD
jgi:hypothetical protein